MQERIKITIYLMIFGGFISVIGMFLIQMVLFFTVDLSDTNLRDIYSSITFDDIARLFIVGNISVGVIALYLVPRIQRGHFYLKRWGAFFGAIAGFLNFIFLYSSGIIRSVDDIQLVLRDLHLTSIFFGIPAALIGAMAGIVVAIILRRFANK